MHLFTLPPEQYPLSFYMICLIKLFPTLSLLRWAPQTSPLAWFFSFWSPLQPRTIYQTVYTHNAQTLVRCCIHSKLDAIPTHNPARQQANVKTRDRTEHAWRSLASAGLRACRRRRSVSTMKHRGGLCGGVQLVALRHTASQSCLMCHWEVNCSC